VTIIAAVLIGGGYVKKDGLLITGQNPASSEAAAKALLEELKINQI